MLRDEPKLKLWERKAILSADLCFHAGCTLAMRRKAGLGLVKSPMA